jgi:hypothetical protein
MSNPVWRYMMSNGATFGVDTPNLLSDMLWVIRCIFDHYKDLSENSTWTLLVTDDNVSLKREELKVGDVTYSKLELTTNETKYILLQKMCTV